MDPKDQIKNRVDLADLIGEYLTLKPTGSTGYRALCPFHQENTPSFHVSKEKQIWKCFGCGEGGDCFSFLMKMEGMDFPEALRHLGKRVGVEVKRFDSKKSNERQRVIAINELAERFFHKLLANANAASEARKYVAKRGIDDALLQRFGIGFAPDKWDALSTVLQKKSYQSSECVKAGLLLNKRSGSGVIDRFRNRIMIPIRDRHGNTVGFTGRIVPWADDEKAPKYMNSPETPIYHKGRILFGLSEAKHAIKKAGEVVIVEGNLDVVASHKAEIEHVVASSGTALTEAQVQLLQRYTNTLIFAFDADAAGFDAARKGMRIAKRLGCDVRVAIIPESAGKDPDDVVQKDPAIWKRAVSETVPAMEYYVEQATAGRDLNDVDDKRAVAKVLLPELAATPDVVEREHWLQAIADLLRTNTNALRKSIETRMDDAAGRARRTTRRQSVSRAAPDAKTEASVQKPPKKQQREERAAVLLLGLFVQTPHLREHITKHTQSDLIPTKPLKQLYKRIVFTYSNTHSQERDHEPQSFFQRLRSSVETPSDDLDDPEILLSLLDRAALEGEANAADASSSELEQMANQLISILKTARQTKVRKVLETQLRRAEQAGDRAEVERLLQQLRGLPATLRAGRLSVQE